MILFSLEKVSKSFPDMVLLDKASLYINDNDKIGIIGPNGCGKSTLIKMILGILSPDSGNVSHGATVNISYLSQTRDLARDDTRIIGNFSDYLARREQDTVPAAAVSGKSAPEPARTPPS